MWSGADSTYLSAITAVTREYTWHGTLTNSSGTTYSFDAGDIVKGSGQLSRMVSSTNSLDVGTVYASELSIRLYKSIDRYSLYGGTIDLYCDVYVGDTTYSVPMGIFTIAECTQELSCISITAYDNMLKFDDIYMAVDQGQSTAYDWINYICGLCGVTLATSEADINAMPNGTELLFFTNCNTEITALTCRDALSYICTVICANAFIGRDGYLYIKQYSTSVTDDINATERFASSLSDFTTHYTAVSATYYDGNIAEYYSESSDTGLTYNVGINPWMQFSLQTARERVWTAWLDSLTAIQYEPYSATLPMRPELDPMDVLSFSGNQASSDIGAITSVTYKIGGTMTVKCSGENPRLAGAKSKSSKEISALLNKVNEDSWYNYYFENTEELSVTGSVSLLTAALVLQTLKEAKLTLIYTVHFDSGSMGRFTVFFYINGEIYKTYKHTFLDGENVATIHFTFNVTSAQINHINILMISESYSTITIDGTWSDIQPYTWEALSTLTWQDLATPGTYSVAPPTLTIPMGYSQVTVFGKGLAATEAWDGTIECSDTIESLTEVDLLAEMTDSLNLQTLSYEGITLADVLSAMTIDVMGSLTDSATLESGILYYSPYILSDNVTLSGITTDGGTWYGSGELDDGDAGTVVVNDEFYTADLVSISATDSGGFYQVSFDSGSTWVGYSGGTWSSDTYMSSLTLASVTNAEYTAESSTVMIMAYVEQNCTVSGIKIKGGIVV